MQTDKDFVPEDEYKLNPCQQISIANSLKFIQNPVRCCKHMHYLIQEVNNIIEKKRSENESKGIQQYIHNLEKYVIYKIYEKVSNKTSNSANHFSLDL